MKRLNQERQEKLEPSRIEYAKNAIQKLGYDITFESSTSINFEHLGSTVVFFPYSGWHSGKSITDGRGLKKLLDQISVK